VAVKVLSGGSGQDVFRRAHRELAAFAAVSSPYLVSLYDAGRQGEQMYYSMEYLPGGSLAAPPGRPGGTGP
jgi:serine/threonine protein kinase